MVIGEAILWLLSGPGAVWGNNPPSQKQNFERKSILIIMEPKIFFCPFCLEPVIRLIDSFQISGQDCVITGVFLWKNFEDNQDPSKSERIIEKKIEGFMEGNEIPFPFILDKNHVFDGLNIEAPAVILLDPSTNQMQKYTFPLSQSQLREIMGFK